MKKLKRVIALILVMCVITALCGCTNPFKKIQVDGPSTREATKLNAYLEYPAKVLEDNISVTPETNHKVAYLFLDNTFSTRGYLMAGTGKASKMATAIDQLLLVMDSYKNTHFFLLKTPDGKNIDNSAGNKAVKWKEVKRTDFKYKSASTYSVFPKCKNPFNKENIDTAEDYDFNDSLTIFITDMAEGQDINKNLASDINRAIMSGKGRSCLLYNLLIPYDGLNSVDLENCISNSKGKIEQKHENFVSEKKPLYMFVTGSTSEIISFRRDFNKYIEEKDFKLGSTYFCESFFSGRGLVSDTADFRTDIFEYDEETMNTKILSRRFKFSTTDINCQLNVVEAGDVFKKATATPDGALFYKANNLFGMSYKGTDPEKDYKRLSFIVDLPSPIEDSDATAEGCEIEYNISIDSVYFANDDTLKPTKEDRKDNSEIYMTFNKMDSESVDNLINRKSVRTVNVNTESLSKTVVKTIHKLKGDILGKIREEDKLNLMNDIEFKALENGSYLVTIDFTDNNNIASKYASLIFNFSITGNVATAKNTPEWVEKYNYTNGKNLNTSAQGLKYVYSYLNGEMSSPDLVEEYSNYLKTTVVSFPVVVDFRNAK